MSAPSPEPDQPSLPPPPAPGGPPSAPPPSAPPGSARKGKVDPGKVAMGVALIFSTLAALVAGIVIGSAARKRIQRLARPYP
jgi:hypothetical protein